MPTFRSYSFPPYIERTGPQRQIRRDPERYVGYGITDSWDEIVETLPGAPVSINTELGAHMREFESMVRRDTDEIYTRLDDEQGQRQLMAVGLNMFGFEIDVSSTYTCYFPKHHVHAMMSEITELQRSEEMRELRAAECTRSSSISGPRLLLLTFTERDDSLQGTRSPHCRAMVQALRGTGVDIAGAGYCISRDSRDAGFLLSQGYKDTWQQLRRLGLCYG
ncbi:hypothetical protein Tco_1108882 [Tanacetum coccineum]